MPEQIEQRILTIVSPPKERQSKNDPDKTYVSMKAEYNGSESWYQIDCPQWEDFTKGDTVSVQLKTWNGKNYVKKMQMAGSAPQQAPQAAPQAAPQHRAKANEFRTVPQLIRSDALHMAVEVLTPHFTTVVAKALADDLIELAELLAEYETNGRGVNRALEMAQAAAQSMGGAVEDDDDIQF